MEQSPPAASSAAGAFVIKNGLLVDGRQTRRSDVTARDGVITAVGRDLPVEPGMRVIDAGSRLVLPGVIDCHVHPTGGENFGTVSLGAAHGGVTTILHFFYPDPRRPWVEMIDPAIAEAERTSLVDFGFHVRIRQPAAELHQLPDMVARGIVSYKMFMAFGKEDIAVDDVGIFRSMVDLAECGALAMVHAENGPVIDYLEDSFIAAGKTTAEYYLASRPTATEAEAIYRAIRLAEIANCDLYLPHQTAAEGLDEIRRGRDRGTRVYAETCPQYLTLTNDDLLARPPNAKIAPPLRTPADRDALWRGLADGTIDVVASDHGSLTREQKFSKTGSIFDDGFGVPGTETLLLLLYDAGVSRGRITMTRLVQLLCEAPARIFGLTGRKGAIVPGADADLLIWDPAGTTTITVETHHSNVCFTPYEGRVCRGRLVASFVRGQAVIENERLVASPGSGRFIRRKRTAGRPHPPVPFFVTTKRGRRRAVPARNRAQSLGATLSLGGAPARMNEAAAGAACTVDHRRPHGVGRR